MILKLFYLIGFYRNFSSIWTAFYPNNLQTSYLIFFFLVYYIIKIYLKFLSVVYLII